MDWAIKEVKETYGGYNANKGSRTEIELIGFTRTMRVDTRRKAFDGTPYYLIHIETGEY